MVTISSSLLSFPSFLYMASLPFTTSPNPSFSRFKPTKPLKTTQTHLPKTQLNPLTHHDLYKSYFHTISSLCKLGQIQAALDLLTAMDFKRLLVGPEIYGEILQGCVYERDLCTGQQIHARIVKNGDLFARNEYIETKLLVFYAKFDVVEIVNSLFDRLRIKNVFSWAAIIGMHCRMGFNEEALIGFIEMIDSGLLADNFVVPNALKACSALRWIRFGRGIHGYAVKLSLAGCVFVSSSLVDMYGKCGVLDDARKIFDKIPERNVVTWNSMIASYVQNGFNEEAMKVFYDMRLEGIELSRVTLSSFLSACANFGAVDEGKQGHAIAVLGGFELDNILGSSILNYYSKVGLIEDAELVFDLINEKDVVTWNLLISSYLQHQQVEKALNKCHLMRLANKRFDSVTLASIISACAKMGNVQLGKEAHCYCIRNNLESDLAVVSSIVDMYAKCEKIGNARQVFNSTTNKDLVLWNTLLTAYAEMGLSGEALKLFYHMQLESVPPNSISWNAVILGLLRSEQVNEAKDMFLQMQAHGMHPNLINSTTLISGLAKNGFNSQALIIFQKMQESEITPNTKTIISALLACKDTALLLHGKTIHGYVLRQNLWSLIPVVTAMVDMYAKCGQLDQAKRISDPISSEASPTYNAMTSSHALHGTGTLAL